eukprot:3686372-Pleurochrysis_carterae.AAC.3
MAKKAPIVRWYSSPALRPPVECVSSTYRRSSGHAATMSSKYCLSEYFGSRMRLAAVRSRAARSSAGLTELRTSASSSRTLLPAQRAELLRETLAESVADSRGSESEFSSSIWSKKMVAVRATSGGGSARPPAVTSRSRRSTNEWARLCSRSRVCVRSSSVSSSAQRLGLLGLSDRVAADTRFIGEPDTVGTTMGVDLVATADSVDGVEADMATGVDVCGMVGAAVASGLSAAATLTDETVSGAHLATFSVCTVAAPAAWGTRTVRPGRFGLPRWRESGPSAPLAPPLALPPPPPPAPAPAARESVMARAAGSATRTCSSRHPPPRRPACARRRSSEVSDASVSVNAASSSARSCAMSSRR